MKIERDFTIGTMDLTQLGPSPETFESTFLIKRDAMRDTISAEWGWNEDVQRKFHSDRFYSKTFHGIAQNGEMIGTLSIEVLDTHLQFGEFYLLKAWRGKGMGTEILNYVTSLADQHRKIIRLEYLKWNPVGSLYHRHGFKVIGQTEIHHLMERRPVSK